MIGSSTLIQDSSVKKSYSNISNTSLIAHSPFYSAKLSFSHKQTRPQECRHLLTDIAKDTPRFTTFQKLPCLETISGLLLEVKPFEQATTYQNSDLHSVQSSLQKLFHSRRLQVRC